VLKQSSFWLYRNYQYRNTWHVVGNLIVSCTKLRIKIVTQSAYFIANPYGFAMLSAQ